LESDLALLKSPPKKEEIEEAVAEVNAAQAVYDKKIRDKKRFEELLEKKLTSQQEYEYIVLETDVARAELDNKKAKLDLLRSPPKPEEEAVIISEIEEQKAKLEFLFNQQDAQSIVAPINGSIVVDQKSKLFLSIVDNLKIEAIIPVSDFNIKLVKLDQEVKLKVRSFTDKVFIGRVVHIPRNAIVQNDKSVFNVSCVMDNDGLLHKGMTGYAKIEIGKISLFGMAMRKIASIIRVEFWSWW